MASLSLGSREVGDGQPVFIVAELSANHGARLDLALRTVEAAAAAGADAIKLQTYTPDTLTLKSDAEPFVVRTKNVWEGRTLHDLYAEAMTPWEWHAELKQAAEALGLVFFSTPFDAGAVQYLEDLGADVHKVASFELTDLTLVEHVARRGHPMILSTGMASLGEIEEAVAACRSVGNHQLALLRCVSAYPARPETMGLSSLPALRTFGTVVGLSDHTRDTTTAIAAVALGAKIVEKHFIVDRAIGGPDSFFSLDPEEFGTLVRVIRETEKALGTPRFGPSVDEVASLRFRRSLFVSAPVRAGELLTDDNVRSVRPSHGIAPKHLPEVLGRPATQDLEPATPLSWQHVGPAAAASVTLRAATIEDAPFLLALRNDDATRAMSRHTAPVTLEEHETWLGAVLADATRALFVAEREGATVGQLRLDGLGSVACEVSLALVPASRGLGLALELLRAAEQEALARGVLRLEATIRPDNTKSIASFKRAGFYAFVTRTLNGESFLTCERRVARLPGGRG